MTVHPIYRVVSFQVVAPYTLRVQFDDQTEQVINFEPVLAGELYRPLRDLALFDQVQIDPEVHILVWPNGADYDPATLHDWPNQAEALAAHAPVGIDTRLIEHEHRRRRRTEAVGRGYRDDDGAALLPPIIAPKSSACFHCLH